MLLSVPSPRSLSFKSLRGAVAPPLATWLLQRSRQRLEGSELAAWVAHRALRPELDVFIARSPHLLYERSEWLLQQGILSPDQRSALSYAVTAEVYLQNKVEQLLVPSALEREQPSSRFFLDSPTKEAEAFGAIAAFWSCQVSLAASVERACVRLGQPREVVLWKQCHSSHSARSLMQWTGASAVWTAEQLGARHPAAIGAEQMFDAYCALLNDCSLAGQNHAGVRSAGFRARPVSHDYAPYVLAG